MKVHGTRVDWGGIEARSYFIDVVQAKVILPNRGRERIIMGRDLYLFNRKIVLNSIFMTWVTNQFTNEPRVKMLTKPTNVYKYLSDGQGVPNFMKIIIVVSFVKIIY